MNHLLIQSCTAAPRLYSWSAGNSDPMEARGRAAAERPSLMAGLFVSRRTCADEGGSPVVRPMHVRGSRRGRFSRFKATFRDVSLGRVTFERPGRYNLVVKAVELCPLAYSIRQGPDDAARSGAVACQKIVRLHDEIHWFQITPSCCRSGRVGKSNRGSDFLTIFTK